MSKKVKTAKEIEAEIKRLRGELKARKEQEKQAAAIAVGNYVLRATMCDNLTAFLHNYDLVQKNKKSDSQ